MSSVTEEIQKKLTEIFKIPRVKVLETWNEQESYWRAKRTEIETVHAVEK